MPSLPCVGRARPALPATPGVIAGWATRTPAINMLHLENIGQCQVGRMHLPGCPMTVIRMWGHNFCYCQSGFEGRYLGTVEIFITKADARIVDVRH